MSSKISKRIAAKEWKRKRRQRQKIAKLSIAVAIAVVVLSVSYIAWDMWSRTYVMTFEGRRIPTDDLRFFASVSPLFGGGANPRDHALEQLTQFLLIERAAQQHNITLTEEDRAQAAENLELFQMIGLELPIMSNERMVTLAGSEFVSNRLMDIYTADFVVDEDDFDDAFANYLMFNRGRHVEMDLRYHLSGSSQAARLAWDDLYEQGPEGYNEIILRDVGEIRTTTLAELRNNPEVDFMAINAISNLGLYELSQPVQIGPDQYAVFIVDSIDALTDDEIREIFREQYEWQQRAMIFSEIIEEWREAADIRVNERGVNAIGLIAA